MAGLKKNPVVFLVLLVALCIAPFIMSNYFLSILVEILILGIFALSLNILVGYTGLVSLGHAAFFGVGAYTSSLIAIHYTSNVFVTLIAGILLSLMMAGMIGFFCNRVNGFYFLMLTLAFSQMFYALVYRWGSLTQGDNGLSGIPKPTLWVNGLLDSPIAFYFFILIIFLIVFIGLSVILHSPLGQIFVGIRENETRVRVMGYNTTIYKNISFILAGGIGGLAGSLYAFFNGFISPKDIYWTMSGEVLIMVLVGGVGTLIGPVLGAAFIVILETFVSSYTDMWMLIVGMTFILFVIFIPKGIVSIGSLWNERKNVNQGKGNEKELKVRMSGVIQDEK
ncbi:MULTISPECIES: branched-chain amino acid ABC transporter permease [Paenibacillus]|uniref:Urea ABC transporter permease n=1 Tax=Paenibacillus naphthalenovorans TaxID=162209 RepID=A0A0U2IMZ1_9BACL|nr:MULTISPECIES: branched-chain amino acid ABC transporter permease [Paenibacillus]ALS23691.1 urea ABC transporter permease [Paenibacillus naphthalenovorans]GCL73530.1 branched-chain amino acid ABC transporter permease [Paenibacillus naphthalenovorans]SDJ37504.1 branched-chain amino acid transport system permease protein [Paenibacillus naphthalenovorans]